VTIGASRPSSATRQPCRSTPGNSPACSTGTRTRYREQGSTRYAETWSTSMSTGASLVVGMTRHTHRYGMHFSARSDRSRTLCSSVSGRGTRFRLTISSSAISRPSYDARAALADHSSGPERFWRNAGPTAGALTPCSAIERAFAKILSQRADIRIGAPLNPPCEKLSVRLDAQTRRALADAASAHDAAGALALARDILEKWFADRIQSEESMRGTTTRRSFPGIFKEQ
jgi:hypothetical protein